MTPIWKDYYVTLSQNAPAEGVAFEIRITYPAPTRTIFRGRAFAKPGATEVEIRINDILAPYFQRAFQPSESTADYPCITASVRVNGTAVATETFYQDYSYDHQVALFTPQALNVPIIEAVAEGQYLPVTSIGGSTSITYYTPSASSVPVGAQATIAALLPLGTIGAKIGNGDIMPVERCIRWVVYYINAFGGWDWLLVRGNVVEGDSIERYTSEREYNNGDYPNIRIQKRGILNYASEVLHRYTINTGPMNEESSQRMHHLLNTNMAVLHDIANNTLMPIIITSASHDYKRGSGFHEYAIAAELAQPRIRR